MPKLIIICGLPGTGKTTLANEISKKLQIFCLHKDSVKESLYESLTMNSFEDSKRLGYPSVKVILDLAEENLSRGMDVIIESPFNFKDDEKIFGELQNKYNLDVYTIVLQLDESNRKKRFLERGRHAAHHDKERERQYEYTLSSYKHMPEKKIFLDSKKSVNELTKEALSFLS